MMKKAKTGKKLLAALLAIVMMLGLLPLSALAADGEIEIVLSYFSFDDNGFPIARKTLTVAPGLSEEYGYPDVYYGASVTALDAIVAAHIEVFGEGGVADNLDVTSAGYITNFMGIGSDFAFFINGVLPGAGAGLIRLNDGDVVELVAMQDTDFSSDAYIWFELDGDRTDRITVGTGETCALALAGVDFVMWGAWGAFPAEFDEYAVVIDMDILSAPGVAIFDGTGIFEESDDYGGVEVVFDAPGSYYLTAVGETYDESPLMGPWLEVTVIDGYGAATGSSDIVNPAPGSDSPGEPGVMWRDALDNTMEYIATVIAPAPVYGNEWEMLALARYGYSAPADYFEGYYESVKAALAAQNTNRPKDANGSANQSTANAKLILALTAIGADAANVVTDIGTYDLLSPLADFDYVTSQGLNGAVYALLAMDSKPYAVDQAVKDELIDFIIGEELSGGGFEMWGSGVVEADATAMVLQALAPYKNEAGIAPVITRAIDALETVQEVGGGYEAWGSIGAESSAQVIVAATALDMDPAVDFVKDKTAVTMGYDGAGNDNPLYSMLRFYMDMDGFANIGGFQSSWALGIIDPYFATPQAGYALVAYARYDNNDNPLYDMSDVTVPLGQMQGLNTYLLEALIAKAEALSQPGYTVVSWNAMTAKLNVAKDTLADLSAMQADVNQAASELNAAINALAADTGGGIVTPPAGITVSLSVTGDAAIVSTVQVTLPTGSSAVALLSSVLDERGIPYIFSGSGTGTYIRSIGGLAEFDRGPNSGWLYSVNGVKPGVGAGFYTLHQGDIVAFTYTDDYTLTPNAGFWAGSGDSDRSGGVGNLPDADSLLADLENWVNPFSDVNESDWFFEAVRFMNVLGYMVGTENGFEPELPLSRAMVVTLLWQLEGRPDMSSESGARSSGFIDVPDDQYYTNAIIWAVEANLVNGYGNGRFGPDDDITREQLVTILFKYATMVGIDTSNRTDISQYTDSGSVSDWALEAMSWAIAEGLVQGRSDMMIDPESTATRAEAATLFMEFITTYLSNEPQESDQTTP